MTTWIACQIAGGCDNVAAVPCSICGHVVCGKHAMGSWCNDCLYRRRQAELEEGKSAGAWTAVAGLFAIPIGIVLAIVFHSFGWVALSILGALALLVVFVADAFS